MKLKKERSDPTIVALTFCPDESDLTKYLINNQVLRKICYGSERKERIYVCSGDPLEVTMYMI